MGQLHSMKLRVREAENFNFSLERQSGTCKNGIFSSWLEKTCVLSSDLSGKCTEITPAASMQVSRSHFGLLHGAGNKKHSMQRLACSKLRECG